MPCSIYGVGVRRLPMIFRIYTCCSISMLCTHCTCSYSMFIRLITTHHSSRLWDTSNWEDRLQRRTEGERVQKQLNKENGDRGIGANGIGLDMWRVLASSRWDSWAASNTLQQFRAARSDRLATEVVEERETRLQHDREHYKEQVLWLPLFQLESGQHSIWIKVHMFSVDSL